MSRRVMLTGKVGHARFLVVDATTDRRWRDDPGRFLSAAQARAMAVQPDMILDTAHIVRDDFARRRVASPRVYADVRVAMNGRPPRRLVDPSVDLGRVGAGLALRDWVLRD